VLVLMVVVVGRANKKGGGGSFLGWTTSFRTGRAIIARYSLRLYTALSNLPRLLLRTSFLFSKGLEVPEN
jgi:hypothetical protein